jgi:CCR4-NOT transcriptional complex subunit CAF120
MQIESLPTRSSDEQPLQNILSISTAGRNRYLLHFNSHHSLLQWTAGIRLAMFEHSTLQEAYTGALIAGKGKTVNNINLIMERARFKTEAWVRVRFGAGVPWRRCWCVISPPDEKEFQRHQKEMRKRSPYDHSKPPVLKGDVKFYDTKKDGKKQKKTKPIASITDAYSCYAIYPQAKSLIDASTLIKIECNITIHSDPPSSTEGFVFIMPEVPPAVNGFEMLLRFLFPTWDTFGLYGRPGRLVASVLDARSLMFAMPKHRRYGYLEILDVTNLILTEGSGSWSEREWKKKLKELTGQRMNAVDDTPAAARSDSRRSKRLSIGPSVPGAARSRGVGFADDGPSVRASRSFSASAPGPRNDSAPPGDRNRGPNPMAGVAGHQRNSSDTQIRGSSSLDGFAPHLRDERQGPTPPRGHTPVRFANDLAPTPERVSSEDDQPGLAPPVRDLEGLHNMSTPEPVQAPPSFQHAATARPQRAYHSPELRRATSRLSSATLQQLGVALQTNTDPALMEGGGERHSDEQSAGSSSGQADPRGLAVHTNAYANSVGMSANENRSREGLSVPGGNPTPPRSPGMPPAQMSLEQKRSRSPLAPGAHGDGQRRPPPGPGQGPGPGPGPYPPNHGGRGQYPPGAGPQGSRGPPPPPHGGGRGRGMPPSGYPQDNRGPPPGMMGQPGPQNQHQPHHPGAGGPPPNSRRTPPPGAQRKPLPPLQTVGSPPIHRKPLPARTDSLQSKAASSRQGSSRSNTGDATPVSPSTNSSLRNHILDEAAFQLVNSPEAHPRDYDQQDAMLQRQRQGTMRSEASSNYDDTASTDSPDYASTRKSTETQESRERPRAGVLKTVGDTAASDSGSGRSRVDMPDINFGPTLNLAHGAERTVPGGPWVPPNPPAAQPPRSFSPGPRKTPAPTTPSANITPFTAEFGHARNESEDTVKRRSIAWQPGVAVGGGSGRDGALSPEEFVAQRAAAATTPQYAHHQRTPSGNALADMAHSPPMVRRTGSQDYLSKRHSRSGSADLLQRPPSRGSGNILGVNGSGGASTTLSAREQEHLARATGTPLISMATNNSQGPQPQGPGLVGAIDAREREKAQMKQGYQSQTVQNAIHQRQQQQQAQQQQVQQQQQQQQQYAQQQYAQQQMYGASNMSMGNLSSLGMSPMNAQAPSMYGGSMGMQSNMGYSAGMGRGGYPVQQPGPPRSATLSPPPVGIGMQVSPLSPRSMSPGPRYAMSPPPLQPGGLQYGHSQGGYVNPGMQPPMRMNSPGPGQGPMRMGSPGPGQGPMRMGSPGPGQGPMRMASPGPGQGPMRMNSPGPGAGPMRMQSPGPGQMRKASPGPGGFSRPMMMPPQGQFVQQGPRTPGTPGTPRGPMPPHQGHPF